jgi:ketosteroid isomerase-like protein
MKVSNMSFDAMAAMVDWIDAYRSGDVEAILNQYADDAMIECSCGGGTTVTGREALRAYWVQRMQEYPASELDDIQSVDDGTAITYLGSNSRVRGAFKFNLAGQIAYQGCSPS